MSKNAIQKTKEKRQRRDSLKQAKQSRKINRKKER
jgi:hypothetical protein